MPIELPGDANDAAENANQAAGFGKYSRRKSQPGSG